MSVGMSVPPACGSISYDPLKQTYQMGSDKFSTTCGQLFYRIAFKVETD